jgi:hypothetical protein
MKKFFRAIVLSLLISIIVSSPLPLFCQGMEPGLKVKGAILADTRGDRWDLGKSIGARPVVIWISNLGPVSHAGVDNLMDLHRAHAGDNVAFFIISTSDGRTAEAFVKDNGIGVPVLLGGTDPLTAELSGEKGAGVNPVDNFFIIDGRGILRFKGHLPGITTKKMEAELSKVLFL